MTPLGYIAKRIAQRPDWLAVSHVQEIFSIANCVSKEFADYVHYWKRLGSSLTFWLLHFIYCCSIVGIECSGRRLTSTTRSISQ